MKTITLDFSLYEKEMFQSSFEGYNDALRGISQWLSEYPEINDGFCHWGCEAYENNHLKLVIEKINDIKKESKHG